MAGIDRLASNIAAGGPGQGDHPIRDYPNFRVNIEFIVTNGTLTPCSAHNVILLRKYINNFDAKSPLTGPVIYGTGLF